MSDKATDRQQDPLHRNALPCGTMDDVPPAASGQSELAASKCKLVTELETIYETTQEALFMARVVGTEFRFVKHNAAHRRLTGLSDIEGKTPVDLAGPVIGRRIADSYSRCIAKGGPISYEETLAFPAGTRVWQTTLAPVFEDGEARYIVGSSRDITEEHRQREAQRQLLRRSECLVKVLQHDAGSLADYLDFVLSQMVELTGSTCGNIHIHDEATRMLTRNSFLMDTCGSATVAECNGACPLWHEQLRRGLPLRLNSAPDSPGQQCFDSQVKRRLCIPVMQDGRIAAIISVANKPSDYTDMDELHLTVLTHAVWQSILRRRDEEMLAKLPQQIPGGLFQFVMRADGTFFFPYVSVGGQEVLQLAPEDIYRDPGLPFARFHPDDHARIMASIRRSYENITLWEETFRVVLPGRGTRWVHGVARPEALADAAVLWYGYLRDTDEIKRTEESLQRSEVEQQRLSEELEQFFLINLDLLCIADLNGRFVKLNRSWEQLLGYPVSELEGKSYFDFIHPDDIQMTMEMNNNLAGQSLVLNFVNRYRCKDGTHKYIEWRSRPSGSLIYAAARDITERIALQRQLENQKEQFELAIRGSNDGIWDWDARSNQLYLSPKLKAQFGFDDHEMPSRITALSRLIHPDDRRRFAVQMKRYLDCNQSSFSVECRMRHKDGGFRWFWVRGEALRDADGRAYRMAGSTTDITERRQGERALAHSHALMRHVIERNPAGIAIHDRNLNYMYVSQRYIDTYQLSGQDIIGRHHYDIFPDLPQRYREVHRRCLQGEVIRSDGDERYTHANGQVDWVTWECHPWPEEDGSIGGIILYTDVINERKSLELAIHSEREQFRTTLLSVGDGIISTDTEGRITVMNPVAEALTGWPQREAAGRPVEAVFHIINEKSRRTIASPVRAVLATGSIVELANHTLLVARNGTETPIEDSAAPIRDEHGGISGVVIVFRDCTEKKEKQSQIERLSFNDHLTGLYNRRYMENALKRLDNKPNLPFAIIVLDVNGLKLTNDAFGHQRGDQLLRQVAHILRQCCRADDILCRTGGDEFAILLPKTGAEQAEAIRSQIIEAARHVRLDSLIVSLAIGYAVKTEPAQAIMDTLREADNRMYRNKVKYGRTMRSQTIETVLRNLNTKYDDEQIHTERVSKFCERIAQALGLSAREIEDIRLAGILHDIGKIMVPPELLKKPVVLTPGELAVIRRHPEIGYQILKSVDEYAALAEAVLHHHEHWDGSGYPAGLAGREIPLQARIIAVADAYEAMTAHRTYQQRMSSDEARAELLRHAGSQFDPDIVRLFVESVL